MASYSREERDIEAAEPREERDIEAREPQTRDSPDEFMPQTSEDPIDTGCLSHKKKRKKMKKKKMKKKKKEEEEEEDRALGTGKPILIEFRDFVLGGNLIRMAVAFVLALSLNNMVSQFVSSFITPILGIIGASDFTHLVFSIRKSEFQYGKFLNAAISFLVICSVLFFCLILPVQRYGGRCVPAWIIRKCPYCCTDMPAIATKCSNCTSTIIPLVRPLKTPLKKKKSKESTQ